MSALNENRLFRTIFACVLILVPLIVWKVDNVATVMIRQGLQEIVG